MALGVEELVHQPGDRVGASRRGGEEAQQRALTGFGDQGGHGLMECIHFAPAGPAIDGNQNARVALGSAPGSSHHARALRFSGESNNE
jgi:hypothetical protein